MRTRFAAAFLLLLTDHAAIAAEHDIRYRGEYTYGHEVNIFCPAINSQCYWLSAKTPDVVRAALQNLSVEQKARPYESVCVVVEGEIDRQSARQGFAADYDGLFTVTRAFGLCTETAIVTQGDLQHHRWLLASVDGKALQSDEFEGTVPQLDFGEGMQVTGNSGCNNIFGKAELRDTFLQIERLASTRKMCAPRQNELEFKFQKLLGSESTISIDEKRNLILDSGETVLVFRLRDWVD